MFVLKLFKRPKIYARVAIVDHNHCSYRYCKTMVQIRNFHILIFFHDSRPISSKKKKRIFYFMTGIANSLVSWLIYLRITFWCLFKGVLKTWSLALLCDKFLKYKKTHGNVILFNSVVVVILVPCCTIVRQLSFILLCNLLCFMCNWNYEMIESSNFIRDQRGRRWFISHKSSTLVLNNLKVNEMLFNNRLWVYCRASIWLVPRVIALTYDVSTV